MESDHKRYVQILCEVISDKFITLGNCILLVKVLRSKDWLDYTA
jgi:hypothetical protein